MLVFETGSTTPFLDEEFQDLRWLITDRVVNGSPVWQTPAVGGEFFMYRGASGTMMIHDECYEDVGSDESYIYNSKVSEDVIAPTALPSITWKSVDTATLESQFASAERWGFEGGWACVPNMRITAVHGMDDNDPTMAEALRKLAALA